MRIPKHSKMLLYATTPNILCNLCLQVCYFIVSFDLHTTNIPHTYKHRKTTHDIYESLLYIYTYIYMYMYIQHALKWIKTNTLTRIIVRALFFLCNKIPPPCEIVSLRYTLAQVLGASARVNKTRRLRIYTICVYICMWHRLCGLGQMCVQVLLHRIAYHKKVGVSNP